MNIVWTKPGCPFCDMAKNLLNQKGIEYEERNIGSGWTREQLLEAVPTAKTVPQIFLNGKYIGTYEHLKNYYYVRKKLEAKTTVTNLNIDKLSSKHILEVGCGLGALTKELIDQGHSVIACDNENYNPLSDYQEQLKSVEVSRKHFYFKIPNLEHVDENIKMFDTLKSYSNKKYDYILWQGNCLYQDNEVSLDCTKTLVKNLTELLDTNGFFIMGYVPRNGKVQDSNFESTESYRWLSPWLTTQYQQVMGYYTWQIPKI